MTFPSTYSLSHFQSSQLHLVFCYLYCCCCCISSVVSDPVRPHRLQPTRHPVPGILQARTPKWVAICYLWLLIIDNFFPNPVYIFLPFSISVYSTNFQRLFRPSYLFSCQFLSLLVLSFLPSPLKSNYLAF